MSVTDLFRSYGAWRQKSRLGYKHFAPTEPGYGFVPTNINPVFSSSPNIRFIF
jgi:hypothetical protein